ncbi:MAG: PAS-domain containing protein [Azospirillaceae bacterium]
MSLWLSDDSLLHAFLESASYPVLILGGDAGPDSGEIVRANAHAVAFFGLEGGGPSATTLSRHLGHALFGDIQRRCRPSVSLLRSWRDESLVAVLATASRGDRPLWVITIPERTPPRNPLDVAESELIDALPVATIVHRDGMPLQVNSAAVSLAGGIASEFLARGHIFGFLPHDVPRTFARGADFEGACFTQGGERRSASFRQSPLESNGRKLSLLSVSPGSASSDAFRTEGLLREAIDNLSDTFILYDSEDRVVLTNRRFHQAFPFLPEQDAIVGMTMREVVSGSVRAGSVTDPTYDPEHAEEWIDSFLARRTAMPIYLEEDRWPDGRWDLVKDQRLSSGAFVSVRTDITDRKRAEIALRHHELTLESELAERTKHLEAVLTNMAQGVIVLDPDLRVVLTNPGLHEIIGYPPELGQRGTHVGELIRDRIRKGIVLPGEEEIDLDEEGLIERRLEAYRQLKRETYAQWYPSGRLIETRRQKLADGSIICTFTDITEQAEAEAELTRQREALYQSEKLSALGMLLAGVAHELNNPLSVVLGQSSMLEDRLKDAKLQDRARRARIAAERCIKIVKTFLAMARGEPGLRRDLEVNAIVRQAVEIAGYQVDGMGVTTVKRLADALPAIEGDPDQITQVVVNLMLNAAQAMSEEAGRRVLTVETGHLAESRQVEIVVSDTGPGVPADLRRRIFDPFFTTKPMGVGTGIGLAMCHGMVAAHGGTITVEDAVGGGACFRVRLPTVLSPAQEEEAAGTTGETGMSTGRILIVDDEAEIAEIAAAFLRRCGFEPVTTSAGRTALEILEDGGIDAVLCDLRMPDLDGPAIWAEIEKRWPALRSRVIFATGDMLSERNLRFLERTGCPCLEKPFTPEDLCRLVRDCLTEPVA